MHYLLLLCGDCWSFYFFLVLSFLCLFLFHCLSHTVRFSGESVNDLYCKIAVELKYFIDVVSFFNFNFCWLKLLGCLFFICNIFMLLFVCHCIHLFVSFDSCWECMYVYMVNVTHVYIFIFMNDLFDYVVRKGDIMFI